MRQNDNWRGSARSPSARRSTSSATRAEDRPDVEDNIFRQITEIEETKGHVRPITLNMVGMILTRTVLSEETSLPQQREMSDCIRRTDVQDYARAVLRRMITTAGTKQPKSAHDLARETSFKSNHYNLAPYFLANKLLNS